MLTFCLFPEEDVPVICVSLIVLEVDTAGDDIIELVESCVVDLVSEEETNIWSDVRDEEEEEDNEVTVATDVIATGGVGFSTICSVCDTNIVGKPRATAYRFLCTSRLWKLLAA